MRVRVSKLDDDLGDQDARPGSPEWIKYFIRRTRVASQELDSDVRRLQDLLSKLERHDAWKTYKYLSFENFCLKELELDLETLTAIRAAPKQSKLRDILLQVKSDAEKAPDVKQGQRTDLELHNNVMKLRQGNCQSYLARRLKKQHVEIFAKLETYPSVRAAAIEAGIIKPETALKLLRKAWKKATEEERQEFLNEIQ